jgi:hypothetical protein
VPPVAALEPHTRSAKLIERAAAMHRSRFAGVGVA